MQNTFYIRTALPYEHLNAFLEMASKLSGQCTCTVWPADGIHWQANGTGESLRSKLGPAIQAYQEHKNLEVKAQLQIQTPNSSSQRISVTMDHRPNDVGYTIQIAPNNAPIDVFLSVVEAVEASFTTLSLEQATLDGLPEFYRRQAGFTEQSIRSLESATVSITQALADQTTKTASYFQQIDERFDSRYAEKLQELETEYGEKERSLREREEHLQQRIDDFNLHESRGVRRELMKRLEVVLDDQKTFQVEDSTSKKRDDVRKMCFIGMFVGGVVYSIGYATSLLTREPNLIAYSPVIVGALVFAGTLIYYIRWSNAWFHQHADLEFQNAQFQKDIIRASWIVELLFEAKTEGEQAIDIPDNLIERFSQSLFMSEKSQQSHHPLDDVYRYAKKFKSIRVGRDGIEASTREDQAAPKND